MASEPVGAGARFLSTHWTTVLMARQWREPQAQTALSKLCQTYWYPLYAFVRRRGQPWPEAQDLTQAFFLHLFESDGLLSVSPERGRFRTFLLTALNNFLSNEWDKQRTQKRGANFQLVSWDALSAEERYALEPGEVQTPNRLFDRRWAFTVVQRVLDRLQKEYNASAKAELFARLQTCLIAETGPGFYAETAAQFGMKEGAVKVALHRLKRRFGELLRSEIAHTMVVEENPGSLERLIDQEIQHLFAAISE